MTEIEAAVGRFRSGYDITVDDSVMCSDWKRLATAYVELLNSIEYTVEFDEARGKPLGSGDVSECLPGWIATVANASKSDDGLKLSRNAANSLAHALLAAKARAERLVKERDDAIKASSENDKRDDFQCVVESIASTISALAENRTSNWSNETTLTELLKRLVEHRIAKGKL